MFCISRIAPLRFIWLARCSLICISWASWFERLFSPFISTQQRIMHPFFVRFAACDGRTTHIDSNFFPSKRGWLLHSEFTYTLILTALIVLIMLPVFLESRLKFTRDPALRAQVLRHIDSLDLGKFLGLLASKIVEKVKGSFYGTVRLISRPLDSTFRTCMRLPR